MTRQSCRCGSDDSLSARMAPPNVCARQEVDRVQSQHQGLVRYSATSTWYTAVAQHKHPHLTPVIVPAEGRCESEADTGRSMAVCPATAFHGQYARPACTTSPARTTKPAAYSEYNSAARIHHSTSRSLFDSCQTITSSLIALPFAYYDYSIHPKNGCYS